MIRKLAKLVLILLITAGLYWAIDIAYGYYAGVIREETKAMSGGLALITQHFDVLRDPLLRLLGFVEPVVAFGRVGRIIARRIVERRARSAEDDEVDDRAGDGGSSR